MRGDFKKKKKTETEGMRKYMFAIQARVKCLSLG